MACRVRKEYDSNNRNAAAAAKSLQSCTTLCETMDCSPPGSSSMRVSRKEYWSGLPFPSPGDLHDPGIEPTSPVLQADSLQSEPPGRTLLQAAQVALVVKKPLPMQET